MVEHDRLQEAAQAMAAQMLKARPGDLARYKQLLDAEAALPFAQVLSWERQRSEQTNTPVPLQTIHAGLVPCLGSRNDIPGLHPSPRWIHQKR